MNTLGIIPAWNEEDRIGQVVAELSSPLLTEILVVDDGSTDETAGQAEKAGARVIRLSHHSGVGAAIRTGIQYGIGHGFDIGVVMNGSGKTDPADLSRLLTPIVDDRADFVQGSRYLAFGRGLNMPFHRAWGTRAYSMIYRFLLGVSVSDASCGIRAFRLNISDHPEINLDQDWLNRYELEPYFLFQAIRLKYRYLEVPITIRYPVDRNAAYTRMMPFVDWWRITRPIIYLALGIKK